MRPHRSACRWVSSSWSPWSSAAVWPATIGTEADFLLAAAVLVLSDPAVATSGVETCGLEAQPAAPMRAASRLSLNRRAFLLLVDAMLSNGRGGGGGGQTFSIFFCILSTKDILPAH